MFSLLHKRRIKTLVGVSLGILIGLSGLLYSLSETVSFYYTPTELLALTDAKDRKIRLGGMVELGSIKRHDLDIEFVLTDYETRIPAKYTGIVPDLFQEESGAVLDGYYDGTSFVANLVLAKHDENYMPPKIKAKQP